MICINGVPHQILHICPHGTVYAIDFFGDIIATNITVITKKEKTHES